MAVPAFTPFRPSSARLTQRVHVPNNLVLGIWVIVIIVQVLGKYMTIRYLDPLTNMKAEMGTLLQGR